MIASKTVALYGGTGAGKSEQAIEFIRYIYGLTGKMIRYIGADGGDWGSRVQPYIDAGVVEAFSLIPLHVQGKSILSAAYKLARGDWPEPAEAGKARFTPATPQTWGRVGGYVYDSMTGIANMIERELQASPNMISGKVQTFKYETDGEKVSGGSWDHIRATQNAIKQIVLWSGALPVNRVLFTFGEDVGSERITKKPEYGPAITGRAAITALPADIGDLLHCEVYPMVTSELDPVTSKPNPAMPVFRIYFVPHPDPITGVIYPAKVRLRAMAGAGLLKQWPNGYLAPTVRNGKLAPTLGHFLHYEDKLLDDNEVAEWKANLDQQRLARKEVTADKPISEQARPDGT